MRKANQRKKPKTALALKKYKIVRTYSAGVFAGEVVKRKGQEVVIKNARRLWSWEKAYTLSDLAVHGVPDSQVCRFNCEVPFITVLEAIEILDVTPKAYKSIMSVPAWTYDENDIEFDWSVDPLDESRPIDENYSIPHKGYGAGFSTGCGSEMGGGNDGEGTASNILCDNGEDSIYYRVL